MLMTLMGRVGSAAVSEDWRCEMIIRRHTAYRAGIAIAGVTSFLTVWTTIVRDDGMGEAYFMVILAAAVGAFAAWFRPAGMARAMIGLAVMQILLGLLVATAPSTLDTSYPHGGALLFNGVFALLWLIAAGLFHAAARGWDEAAAIA